MKLNKEDISKIKYNNSDTVDLFGKLYVEIFHRIPFKDLRIVARYIHCDFPDFKITRVNPVVQFDNILDLSIGAFIKNIDKSKKTQYSVIMKLSEDDVIQLNRKPSSGPYNTRAPIGAACSIRKTVLKQCFVALYEQNAQIDSTLTFNCCQYIDQFNVGIIHDLLEQ